MEDITLVVCSLVQAELLRTTSSDNQIISQAAEILIVEIYWQLHPQNMGLSVMLRGRDCIANKAPAVCPWSLKPCALHPNEAMIFPIP